MSRSTTQPEVTEVLALRAENNLLAAIRVWASAAVGGELLDDSGVLGMRVDAPLRAFNQAIFSDREVVNRSLATVADWFRDRPRYRIRLRDHLVPGNEPSFSRCRLVEHGGIPSLALAPIGDTEPLAIDGVEIRPVDESNLRDHVDVVQEAFDWETSVLETVFTERLPRDSAWHAYVAYIDGQAAATTQLVVSEEVAGLYYVGTREAFRGRGLGEAVTRHAVRQGADLGCDMASLQASPQGYPVYKRIGFKDVAYYVTFVGSD
jgi:ribosomal protein S18 acetylase RimI-like enzyme